MVNKYDNPSTWDTVGRKLSFSMSSQQSTNSHQMKKKELQIDNVDDSILYEISTPKDWIWSMSWLIWLIDMLIDIDILIIEVSDTCDLIPYADSKEESED